mgnify:CR=1 FL=1
MSTDINPEDMHKYTDSQATASWRVFAVLCQTMADQLRDCSYKPTGHQGRAILSAMISQTRSVAILNDYPSSIRKLREGDDAQ